MAVKLVSETDAAYRKRLEQEIGVSSQKIRTRLKRNIHSFAFPYGDGSTLAIELLRQENISYAATVHPGGNPAFASPYLLRRTMILGDGTMNTFKAALETERKVTLW